MAGTARSRRNSTAYKSFVVLSFISLFIFIYFLLWKAYVVLLLAFAGILFGIFLHGLSELFSRKTKISYGWSLVIVVLLLTGLFTIMMILMGPGIADQFQEMIKQIPQSPQSIRNVLNRYEIGRTILQYIPSSFTVMPAASAVFKRLSGFFSNTAFVLTGILIVFATGIYLASNPNAYRNHVLELLPPRRRRRAHQIMDRLHDVLWWWVLGRIVLMISNGLFTTIGLWALQVPLALTLGVIAGILNFIPNIGPIIAAVPAVLIALIQSPEQALYVIILYLVLQSIDGYVFTPMVDKRAVSLPAAVVIFSQLLFGTLMGFLGLLLATPLATTTAVLIQALYVEDKIEKDEKQETMNRVKNKS